MSEAEAKDGRRLEAAEAERSAKRDPRRLAGAPRPPGLRWAIPRGNG